MTRFFTLLIMVTLTTSSFAQVRPFLSTQVANDQFEPYYSYYYLPSSSEIANNDVTDGLSSFPMVTYGFNFGITAGRALPYFLGNYSSSTIKRQSIQLKPDSYSFARDSLVEETELKASSRLLSVGLGVKILLSEKTVQPYLIGEVSKTIAFLDLYYRKSDLAYNSEGRLSSEYVREIDNDELTVIDRDLVSNDTEISKLDAEEQFDYARDLQSPIAFKVGFGGKVNVNESFFFHSDVAYRAKLSWARIDVDESDFEDFPAEDSYSGNDVITDEREFHFQGLVQVTFGFGFVF